MKIFTTQLTGLFQRLSEQQEEQFEDAARVLAQAAMGDGAIHIYGADELQAVVLEALSGAEPLAKAVAFNSDALEAVDRVILFSRFVDDEAALAIGQQLVDAAIPFVSVAATRRDAERSIADLSDVHIDTKLAKPLIPGEDGERFAYPSGMVALYVYHLLAFTINEFVEEY